VQSAQCGVGFFAVHWGLDDAVRYGVYQCKNKSVPFCPVRCSTFACAWALALAISILRLFAPELSWCR
jgi:hypothetical protein